MASQEFEDALSKFKDQKFAEERAALARRHSQRTRQSYEPVYEAADEIETSSPSRTQKAFIGIAAIGGIAGAITLGVLAIQHYSSPASAQTRVDRLMEICDDSYSGPEFLERAARSRCYARIAEKVSDREQAISIYKRAIGDMRTHDAYVSSPLIGELNQRVDDLLRKAELPTAQKPHKK